MKWYFKIVKVYGLLLIVPYFLRFQNINSILCTINSNMATVTRINVNSDFASAFSVYQIGNVVSVDIDGYITAPVNTIFATGFPIPIFVIWVQDLAGHHFRLYNGNLKCNMELNGKEYTNLHFTYLCV